ncbi:hypothetical protein GGI05_006401, partial [Coemansia sp. RSA 2603]
MPRLIVDDLSLVPLSSLHTSLCMRIVSACHTESEQALDTKVGSRATKYDILIVTQLTPCCEEAGLQGLCESTE